MQISKVFAAYNQRRYSKPWGAVVTFPDQTKPSYDFVGHYDGGSTGGAGNVVMQAQPGSIVAFGQRDNRGSSTSKTFYFVDPNGSLREVSESEARERVNAARAVDRDALAAERTRLRSRLAEIDQLLSDT